LFETRAHYHHDITNYNNVYAPQKGKKLFFFVPFSVLLVMFLSLFLSGLF